MSHLLRVIRFNSLCPFTDRAGLRVQWVLEHFGDRPTFDLTDDIVRSTPGSIFLHWLEKHPISQ